MKRKQIYLTREETFQVGYTITHMVKNLKKNSEGHGIDGTDIYYSDEEIEMLKKVFNKLNIAITWEQLML